MSEEISLLRYEDVRKQIGHYKKIDYHPEIRPAGAVVLSEGIEHCLKDYKLEDGVDALISAYGRRENKSRDSSSKTRGTGTGVQAGVKSCLEMTKRTPFQALIEELKNTAMNSYWKKEVGRTPDQTSSLPPSVDPVLTTFGKSVESNGTAAELVNPRKSASGVIAESRVGHELYRKSHNDYYPSEQVNRDYVEPFDRKTKYGRETRVDKLGGKVKRSMRWFDQDVASVVSNLQADFEKDTQSRLGRAVVRADIANLLEGRTFGKANTRGSHGVGDLLRNSSPNGAKPMLEKCLEHINALRLSLRKRAFEFDDLHRTFAYHDSNKTRTTTLEETYRILESFRIYPEKKTFENLINALNFIRDDAEVVYKDVTDLLNWKCEFPPLPKIDDIPPENQSYCTTYKETICGARFPKGIPRYTAGIGTERVDVPYAVVPLGGSRCERENLGDQTSMRAVISPNIFTQNGLSHLDFFKIRKADEIRTLFEDTGMNFPGDSFNTIWNEGMRKDRTGGVCVETFRSLLDELAAGNYEDINILSHE